MENVEHRLVTLESNHQSFVFELRQITSTLLKIEHAIEKQNEIITDVRLLRQEFKSHTDMEVESVKRQNARIEKTETNQSRVAWLVITAVVGAVMTLLLGGHYSGVQ